MSWTKPGVLAVAVVAVGCPTADGPQPTVRPQPVAPARAASVQQAPQAQRPQPPTKSDSEHTVAIIRIAQAIAELKGEYPQLAEFSTSRHVDRAQLKISYGYRTHPPRHRGGWTSGVPNPDDDGVWFYIDFHDPGSTAQIHTQPVVPDLRRGDKKVMVLILEGKRTRRLGPAIDKILKEHGVRPGP